MLCASDALTLANDGIQSVSDQSAAPKRREKRDSDTGLLWPSSSVVQ
jgi:hypothetical protein